MTSTTGTDRIVEEMADIQVVLRDDIHVSDDTATTYVPLDSLENAPDLEGIRLKFLRSTSTNT